VEALTEIRLVDFTDAGYLAMQELQKLVESRTLSDGKARWVLPHPRFVAVMAAEEWSVVVSVEFTSHDPTTDMSWPAAKAYIYALYLGAADRIKRRARREGPRRFVGVDEEASADAQLGDMHVKVTVTVRAA
jgi:hypothetical protein